MLSDKVKVFLFLASFLFFGSLLLLYPVGYQPLYPLPVTGVQLNHFIKEPPDPLGFMGAKMALGPLDPHNLAAAGNVEAALGPFMGFDLWHSELP
jgi:hypothetical protein